MTDWTGSGTLISGSTTETDVIESVKAFTYLSVQTEAESALSDNVDANILYNSSSESQSNFTRSYAAAKLQVAADESSFGITFSDDEELMALAYLIQHFHERKFKDHDAIEINLSNDIVKKNVSQTSGWASYQQILRSVYGGSLSSTDRSTEIDTLEHSDSLNYPDDWKNDQLDLDDIELEA